MRLLQTWLDVLKVADTTYILQRLSGLIPIESLSSPAIIFRSFVSKSASFDVAPHSLQLSFHPEEYKLEAPASESCLFEIKLTNCRQKARNSLACAAGLYERRNIKMREHR
jgi:hypothetical protein